LTLLLASDISTNREPNNELKLKQTVISQNVALREKGETASGSWNPDQAAGAAARVSRGRIPMAITAERQIVEHKP
jgi:hypothetical protein